VLAQRAEADYEMPLLLIVPQRPGALPSPLAAPAISTGRGHSSSFKRPTRPEQSTPCMPPGLRPQAHGGTMPA